MLTDRGDNSDTRMTTKLFSELGLSPEVLKAIDKLGFEQASPIQAESIPVLLSGKDIVGQSQTVRTDPVRLEDIHQ